MYKQIRKWFNRTRRLRLVRGPFSYNENGLSTIHNADFAHDKKFLKAYRQAEILVGWRHPAPWRVYFNVWAASHAVRLKGDFVECGVWNGFTALVVSLYLDLNSISSRYILVDSFEGVRIEDLTKEERAEGLAGKNETYLEYLLGVEKNFSRFRNVQIVKGFVPDILPELGQTRVGYLHIDMNYAVPEIAAAEFFWDQLLPGAVVVLDDYGFRKHRVQKTEFDKWAANKGVSIFPLPTGQGFFLK